MRTWRKYPVIFCTAIVAALFGGCGAGSLSSDAINEMVITETMSAVQWSGDIYESAVELDEAELSGAGEKQEIESSYRKLIKTVSMDVETEEFDVLLSKLEQRVEALNGYIETSDISGNSRYYVTRSADLTIRIPQDKLDGFIEEVAEISNITWKSENVKDITLEYVDVESRKRALEIEQERLMELLEQAESVEEIISIESRLSDVRYELQSYASQLLVYDNQVNYSTVYLDISEVQRLTPQEEPSVWEQISTGFTDNFYGLLTLIENIAVGVIILAPYWVAWLLVVLVLLRIGKYLSDRQKKKRDRLWQEARERKDGEENADKKDL